MYTWLPVAVPFLASLCFRLSEDPKQCSSILIGLIRVWYARSFIVVTYMFFYWYYIYRSNSVDQFSSLKPCMFGLTPKQRDLYYNMPKLLPRFWKLKKIVNIKIKRGLTVWLSCLLNSGSSVRPRVTLSMSKKCKLW